MFYGKFIVPAEFAFLSPLNVFHHEEEKTEYSHPKGLENLHISFLGRLDIVSLVPERVIIRLTADDYYKLYINGEFVCQGPAQGYPQGYNWNEADITDRLIVGENEIRAEYITTV